MRIYRVMQTKTVTDEDTNTEEEKEEDTKTTTNNKLLAVDYNIMHTYRDDNIYYDIIYYCILLLYSSAGARVFGRRR